MFEYFSKENRQKRKENRQKCQEQRYLIEELSNLQEHNMTLKSVRTKIGFTEKLSAMVLGLSLQKYIYYENHQDEFSPALIDSFRRRLILYKTELIQNASFIESHPRDNIPFLPEPEIEQRTLTSNNDGESFDWIQEGVRQSIWEDISNKK